MITSQLCNSPYIVVDLILPLRDTSRSSCDTISVSYRICMHGGGGSGICKFLKGASTKSYLFIRCVSGFSRGGQVHPLTISGSLGSRHSVPFIRFSRLTNLNYTIRYEFVFKTLSRLSISRLSGFPCIVVCNNIPPRGVKINKLSRGYCLVSVTI